VVIAGAGLDALRKACEIAGDTPVLALGGVTGETARLCVEAGAAGVAGIRLFRFRGDAGAKE
jgi:thiamine-phosphate pyrophosphorylase